MNVMSGRDEPRFRSWLEFGDRSVQRLVLANLAGFVALSVLMFRLQSPVTFYRFDGTFLLSVVRSQPEWMATGGVYSMNLLEGIGGLWFPTAMSLIPGFVVANLLPSDSWLAALSFVWFATELYLAILLLSWTVGLSVRIGLLAAWIAVLGACPYWVPTPALERLWGNPHLISAVAYVIVGLCVFFRLGRDESLKRIALRAFFIVALFFYLVVSQPLITPVGLAAFGFLALLLSVQSLSWREAIAKLSVLVILTVALASAFAPFFIGLFGYAKTTFFWNDMIPFNVTWRAQSFLLEQPRRPLGELLWLLALVGAAIAAFGSAGEIRRLARAFLGLVALLLGTAVLVAIVAPAFSGTTMAYFDMFAYPIYALFAARLIAMVLSWGVSRVGPYVKLDTGRQVKVALLAMLLLPWLSLVFWRAPYSRVDVHNQIPFRWPPLQTELTNFLVPRIALVKGGEFRGRLVNIAGVDFEPQFAHMPFVSQHNYDSMIARFLGNDHRMYGLWRFGIPTLIENNQFSSPFFHLISKSFFNPDGILQSRPQTTITTFNEAAFRRLGVRYVLTEKPVPERQAVLTYKVVEGRAQNLYELPRPNLHGRSVTRVTAVDTARDAVSLMKSEAFGEAEAVTFDRVDGPLSAASGMSLKTFRDHVRFAAESSGQSLVVLPLEFSRCLSVEGGGPNVRLLRVDVDQLGVLFSGRVDIAIALRFGPFSNRWCRYNDLEDARRLL